MYFLCVHCLSECLSGLLVHTYLSDEDTAVHLCYGRHSLLKLCHKSRARVGHSQQELALQGTGPSTELPCCSVTAASGPTASPAPSGHAVKYLLQQRLDWIILDILGL